MTCAPLLPENVSALSDQPDRLQRIAATEAPDQLEAVQAADGAVTARWQGMPIHHAAQPLRDARRWASDAIELARAQNAQRVAVVGFGLGHHVEALAAVFEGEILVYEPNPGLLRWALSAREMPDLLRRIRLEDEPEDGRLAGACVVPYAPLRLLEGAPFAETVERCRHAAARSVGKLRVLVVTPLYGGSHPIALHACRALGALGHEAELCDLAEFHGSFQRLSRFAARPSRLRATESLFCDALGDGVAARVEEGRIDVVLALAQAPLGARALAAIRRAGALSALWFVEDRRLFPYWREIGPEYDHVFTIQSHDAVTEMRAAGVRRADVLPCAAAPDVHRPRTLSDRERREYGSDVSFVGAGYRNRRHAFRRFLDLDFRIWGSDWEGAPELSRVLQRGGERVSSDDSVRVWNASKVNLNLHSSTYCDGVEPRGDFVNPRTFELAASEAFQIVDRRSLLSDCFEPGREIVVVDDVEEMRAATVHYLERPEERRAIASAGRERVRRDHTYEHRMERLLATLVSAHPEHFARREPVYTVGAARSVASGALAEHLTRFPEETPFTLENMVGAIPDAEGPLSDPEALFLFLSQFDDLYLQEYRR